MKLPFERLASLGLAALVGMTVACGDQGTGPEPVEDEPDPRLQANDPAWPKPSGPQPVLVPASDLGPLVRQATVPALNVTMVGKFRQELLIEPADLFNSGSTGDRHGENSLYASELGDLDDWLRATGAVPLNAADACVERREPVAFRGEQRIERLVRECVTFHPFSLDRTVDLQEFRYWRNLGSRVLAPGTEYTLEARYTEGVETTNGYEFNATHGRSEVNEQNWNRCSRWSAQASGTFKGFSLGGGGGQENCYGGSSAQGTSQVLENTYGQEVTVTEERERVEAKTFTGAPGVYRVFTMWQRVKRFQYVNPDGTTIRPEDLLADAGWTESTAGTSEWPAFTAEDAAEITRNVNFTGSGHFPAGTPRTSVEWTPVFVTWPEGGFLDVGTPGPAILDSRDFAIR